MAKLVRSSQPMQLLCMYPVVFIMLAYSRKCLESLTHLRVAAVGKNYKEVYGVIRHDIFVEKEKNGSAGYLAGPEVPDFDIKSQNALI